MPSANFYAVARKADTDPLFPDDPFIAANRRVTITLMREAPRSRRISSPRRP
jgi:chemotaxis protein MotB